MRETKKIKKETYHFWPEEIAVLQPPERLKISEWTEKYRSLPPSAAEKGPMRLKRTPYLVPIMDACLDPHVEQVWFCKSAQIAGTEFTISVLGFFTDQEPCPCMMVLADEDTAKYMSKERIQRMYRDSEKLSGLIQEDKFNIAEITLKNDSYIALGWSSSVAKLASRPMRLVIFDEIDKPGYKGSLQEASPISLGIERTESFINRKIVGLSTPTLEDGNINKRLDGCDVVYDWHVPCPDCGQFQPLRWDAEHCHGFKKGQYRGDDGELHNVGGVTWDGGSNATQDQIAVAKYCCGECGSLWTTLQKNEAVRKGKMVSRDEIVGKPARVGYHINRLYSLLAKSGDLGKLVDDWLRCLKTNDKKELQGFINSTLGEPWVNVIGKDREKEAILSLKNDRPPKQVPDWALVLIITADVQENGIWYELRAWGENMTSALLRHGFLVKTQTTEEGIEGDFAALSSVITETYETASKTEYHVRFGVMDSAYRTSKVYDFCRKTIVVPSKGMQAKATPITYTKIDTYPGTGKIIPGGLQLASVDTTYWKDELADRLEVNVSDPGAWQLHKDTDEGYADQYVSEIKNEETGTWQIKRGHLANHLWDCGVLQLVAVKILENQGLLKRIAKEKEKKKEVQPLQQRPPEPTRQALW